MKQTRSVLLCFSLIAFSGAALAAGNSASGQSSQQGASGGSSSMQSQQGQRQSAHTMPVSQLQDMKVVGAKGEDVGSVSDVILDLSNQRVHAVVIESGGWFGIGGNNYAFPVSDLKPGKQRDQLVLNVPKQKLENKKGFAKSQWPGLDDEYWTQTGNGAAASGGTQKESGGSQTNLVRASELKGKQVQGKTGEEIGEVNNVIVGLNDGRIHGLTLDVKDGGQARIPAKQLSRGTDGRLVIGMDAQQVRSKAKQSNGHRNAGSGASGQRQGQQPPQQQQQQPQQQQQQHNQ